MRSSELLSNFVRGCTAAIQLLNHHKHAHDAENNPNQKIISLPLFTTFLTSWLFPSLLRHKPKPKPRLWPWVLVLHTTVLTSGSNVRLVVAIGTGRLVELSPQFPVKQYLLNITIIQTKTLTPRLLGPRLLESHNPIESSCHCVQCEHFHI